MGYGYNTGYRFGGSSSGYARSSGAATPAPAPGIALVTSVSAVSPGITDATTAAVNTTGANLIVLMPAWTAGAGGGPSVSDSAGNVWTALTIYSTPNSDRRTVIYYKINPTVSATHTFTYTSVTGATYPSIAMMAFSGAAGGYNLVQNGAGANVATTLATGSVAPSANNCVLVTGLSFEAASGVATINSGFTVAQSLANAGGAAVAVGYKAQTVAGAENPTWTSPATGGMAVTIAVFKPTV